MIKARKIQSSDECLSAAEGQVAGALVVIVPVTRSLTLALKVQEYDITSKTLTKAEGSQ